MATAIFCLYGSPPIQSMVTWPPPLYVLLNCLIRLPTTCWADEGCVVVHIVMVSPDPELLAPTPPQAARPVAVARAAAAAVNLYLAPVLENIPFSLAFQSGEFATEDAVDAGQAEQLTYVLRPGIENLAVDADRVEAVPGAPVGQGQHRPGR